jgi:hypothetical protein
MQMWQLTLPMLFVLGLTCFAMGFIALLKQKLYIDSKTKQPTEVSLPIIGKMKTNYPALVFVFVGAAAMYQIYSFKQPDIDAKDDYLIRGRIEISQASTTGESRGGAANLDFSTSIIMPFPSDVSNNQVDSDGTFSVKIKVPRGKEFEDYIQWLQLSGPTHMIGSIIPAEAKKDPRILIRTAPNLREYRMIVDPQFPGVH